MSFVAGSVIAGAALVAAAGTVAYAVNSSKQKAKTAKNALANQQQQDAQDAAKAETDAATEANSLRVAQKRAYQANALALGGFADDSLGAPSGGAAGAGSVLSQGASAGVRATAASSTSGYTGATALGAGASGGGGTARPGGRVAIAQR